MVLVSGGTGFLGSHLLFDLIIRGEKVRAIKRFTTNLDNLHDIFGFYTDRPDEMMEKIEWVEADLLDYHSLVEAMKEINQVYHVAAFVSFNPNDKYKMLKNNVEGTANMINAALEMNIKKFCHVSSISAIGNSENGDLRDEKLLWKPSNLHSNYSVSKYFSEMEVWRGIEEGLKAIIVNPSLILGPGNWNYGSPSLFNMAAKGTRYYTDGINGFVDVRDVTKAMIELMNCAISGERFIISSENMGYRELFNLICEVLSIKKPDKKASTAVLNIAYRLEKLRSFIIHQPPRITKENVLSSMDKKYFSNKKIKDALNFEFRTIKQSIEDIAVIYLNQRNK
jgi:nucleoside-diphosphate-sugar epimerase